MADAELTAALKQAKGKKMFFVFIPKGGSDGQLIVAKAKIPPKHIADAKKAIGGGNPVTGKCYGGNGGAVVFQVAKAPPPALAAVVKKVAKRDTGLNIDPEFQLAGDADTDEPNAGAAAADGAAVASLNLGPWQAARQNAITDLKALATKVAGTKHGSAAAVLKEINVVITRLPAKPGPTDLDKLADFIRNDETITAAEKIPARFHDLDIREPLLHALAGMRQ
jgi:hypothetical protein